MFGDWDHDGHLGMEDIAKTTLVVGMMDDCEFMTDEEESPRVAQPQENNAGCLHYAIAIILLAIALTLFFEVASCVSN